MRAPADEVPGDAEARRRVQLGLTAVLLVAALLRFPGLDVNPPGLWCDEASTGYDARSLLETGRDQHGEAMPLFAKSFGDWNEASYRYLAIPFVAVLGLNEVSVRFPAAVLGLLAVWLLFAVGRELYGPTVGLCGALMLAVSPWHVHFSRIAFRGIILPTALLAALLLALVGRRRPRLLPLTALTFGLALWTYTPARVFVPLFGLGVLLLYRRALWPHRRMVLLSLGLFLPLLGGLLTFWLSDRGMARVDETLANGPLDCIANYFKYFDPRFLFWSGDPSELNSPRGLGELHVVELASVGAGLWWVLRRAGRPHRGLVLLWLLLYPIPACMTESPNALRAITGAPLMALLSGAGVAWIAGLVGAPPLRHRRLRQGAAALALAASLGWFGWRQYARYPIESAMQWDYGLREAYSTIERLDPPCAVVSDSFFLPHAYILFYTGYPPEDYQRAPVQGVHQGFWFATDYELGRYHVKNMATLRLARGRCVFMLRPTELRLVRDNGHTIRPLHEVRAPDGLPVVSIVEVAPRPRPRRHGQVSHH